MSKPKKQKRLFIANPTNIPYTPSEFFKAFFKETPPAQIKKISAIAEAVTEGEPIRAMDAHQAYKRQARKWNTLLLMSHQISQHGFPIRVYHSGRLKKLDTWQQCVDFVEKGEVKD